MNQAVLKIDNCTQCPHHVRITSAYTGDSFDMADEDSICTKVMGGEKIRGAHKTVTGRLIWGSERWWEDHHTAVPKWCPLLATSKDAK